MAPHQSSGDGHPGGVLARLGLARGARDERCLVELSDMRERARREGLQVVRVREVRKVGVRGTAAWTVLDDGTEIDSWFWGAEPVADCFLLVQAEIRRGSHSDEQVLFVGRGEPVTSGIVDQLAPRVTSTARRHELLVAPGEVCPADAAPSFVELRDAA